MAQAVATRLIEGVELPVSGTWSIDPSHTEVGFIGRHFMLTKVRGRFIDVDGTVDIASDPAESRVIATINMASVASGDDLRDEHLKSPDFFDVENHPEAKFASTNIDWNGTTGTMTGDLTIKDVTKPVTLDVSYLGHAEDPWGNNRAVFDAAGQINREDWGLTWNMVLESGGLVVSKQIDLELHLELILSS